MSKNDSSLVIAKEALHLARAYNSFVHEARALQVIVNYYFDKESIAEVA